MAAPVSATASASSALVMLHLGLGSFHRAHQAAYLQRLQDTGDTGWVLAAGNIRPDMPDTIAALRAQAGAYTLETVTPTGERSYARIASIRTVVPWDEALSGLVARGRRRVGPGRGAAWAARQHHLRRAHRDPA